MMKEDIEFILSHFGNQHELFPRTIMTLKSHQIKIEFNSDINRTLDQIYRYFEKADYKDCRINAFPYNSTYHMAIEINNRTAADFVFIDLDLKNFDNGILLDKRLYKTLKKMNTTLKGAHPTVLWTGRGYHIYQPLEGMIFEKYEIFCKFLPYLDGRDLTTEFLRFVKEFFTDKQADLQNKPSINSCLTRVPGSINSKCLKEGLIDDESRVKIIQEWDGIRPNIRYLTDYYLTYLIQRKINKLNEFKRYRRTQKGIFLPAHLPCKNIKWIDNLLQTPVEDYRKEFLWRILCPYLINWRKLSAEEASEILLKWLNKCDKLRKLDFNPKELIKNDIKQVKSFLPPRIQKLKENNGELYNFLKSRHIIPC